MTGLKTLAGSVTGKVTFIGLLILVLLIPLGMIEGLVAERSQLYDAWRATTSGGRGGEAQIVGGPILIVPFSYTLPKQWTSGDCAGRAVCVAGAARDQRQRRGRGTAPRHLRGARLYRRGSRDRHLRARDFRRRVSGSRECAGTRLRSRCRSPTHARCASRSCSEAATPRLSSKPVVRACRACVPCSLRPMRRSALRLCPHRWTSPSSSFSAAPGRSASCRSATRRT